MRRFVALLTLLVTACGQSSTTGDEIGVDNAFDNTLASQALAQVPFDLSGLRVHAVCGPASGKGLLGEDGYAEFQSDGITDGRLIFVSGVDGSGANLIFRDATGTYISSVADGTSVKLISPTTSSDEQMWVVSNDETGVVESHNLFVNNGRLVDLWTSNKPSLVLGPPSAKIFVSNCVRP